MSKTISVILYLFVLAGSVFANAAQPGIWNSGGMGNFSLLFPDDSLSYKKIQMVNERVSIILYKGYSVVKGEYKMYNDTQDTIKIRTGYPLNSSFKSETAGNYRADISFDSLYGLNVLVNSVPVNLIAETSEHSSGYLQNSNWYVWNNTFAPEDTTVITVYFIVNTNDNIIRKGYTKDENNGFIYVLETGSTWKQPIVKGEIRILIEDEMNTEDIKGLKPDSAFRTDEKNNILQYNFSNISPTNLDNIIITYFEKVNDLNFKAVLNKKDELYEKSDEFSVKVISSSELTLKKYNSPFDVESTDWTSLLLILSIVGIPLLILILITVLLIIFIFWLYRRNKKRKGL
ncbi:MAG TPA: hypothetical protein PKC91_04850 [Ignavibacteria bacterium]|nr:hypothetical protein [Ignavibacteria bacterium]